MCVVHSSILPLYAERTQAAFAKRIESDLSHTTFFMMSDVWLDDPDTLRGLRRIFDNCIENDYIPLVLIMCGNFSRKGIAHGNARDVARYTGEQD